MCLSVVVQSYPVAESFTGFFVSDVASTLSDYWNCTSSSLVPFLLIDPITRSPIPSYNSSGSTGTGARRLLSVNVVVPLIVLGNITSVAGPSAVAVNVTMLAGYFVGIVTAGNFTAANAGALIPAQTIQMHFTTVTALSSSSSSSSSTGNYGDAGLEQQDVSSLGAGQIAGITVAVVVAWFSIALAYAYVYFYGCFTCCLCCDGRRDKASVVERDRVHGFIASVDV
jgi:hypothetical protein